MEHNYTITERECYSIVWAVATLRPYIEGETFTVRTDHDALRWLMTLTDSSGGLMRWRLRLSEFDFTIQYCPGIFHQVPGALSRIISPQRNDDLPVHDEAPTFEYHENVLVTTRIRKRASNVTTANSERNPRTSDPRGQRKRNEIRQFSRNQRKTHTRTTKNAWYENSTVTSTVTVRKKKTKP